MIRAGLALAAALALSSCTAIRLARQAGPMDCRTVMGVPVHCSEKWP